MLDVAVMDLETDPFKVGRIPEPFACGFKSANLEMTWWGKDCVARFIQWLVDEGKKGVRYLIFAHNGGRFDFHYMFPWMENPLKIINGRIVKARLGEHWLQDSFAIIPVPLHYGGEKTKIDYDLFEPDKREDHRDIIIEYLMDDCRALYNFVTRFIDEFGRQLTVGSTAIKQLIKRHPFERITQDQDTLFRPFYFGGRVECFKAGIMKGDYKSYDKNSMYPHVMRAYRHPINGTYVRQTDLPDDPDSVYFAEIEATSRGALPVKTKTGISFPHAKGTFLACCHEIRMALKYDLLTIHSVNYVQRSVFTTTFAEFVDYFYSQRLRYAEMKDPIGVLFAKFMLNSAYGKTGQSPDNFKDWLISEPNDMEPKYAGYKLYSQCPWFDLWERPAIIKEDAFYDVTIAASITSAARAELLEGIQHADDPLYCDTDSIICRSLDGDIDAKRLGAWKLEKTADTVLIAGKKLYALKQGKTYIKTVCKGGTLTGADIARICRGQTVEYINPVPTYSPDLNPQFITRKFRKTA